MAENWITLPMVLCPNCNKEYQMDDYYDVSRGDEYDCPNCEKTIYFNCVDHIIEACVSTSKTA